MSKITKIRKPAAPTPSLPEPEEVLVRVLVPTIAERVGRAYRLVFLAGAALGSDALDVDEVRDQAVGALAEAEEELYWLLRLDPKGRGMLAASAPTADEAEGRGRIRQTRAS